MPTHAGFNQNFDLNKYPGSVRMALRRIADTFYVTRSFNAEYVDNSVYYAALIRPTDETSVILNAQRELLVLFADYATFEIRTLEAYRIFLDLVDSSRIDQSIRFLVSADENIDSTIKHYLDQHPEYPIIVPVTFHDIERRSDPLISAVRKNYLIRDLFGFQSPLREEHFFFGRSEIVSRVIDLAKSGQHSSLFGLRKSGKTSTIYAIQRKCRANELTVTTFDCQDLTIHARRYGDLLVHIVNQVRLKNSLKAVAAPANYEGVGIAEWFNLNMAATLNSLKSNLLIIFDEIENISPLTAASEHWRNGKDAVFFWQIIRSFCQTSKNRTMSVCIVGTSPYLLEESKIQGIDNPVYLLAIKTFIPNLTFDETRQMIQRLGFFMGLDFDPQAIAKIHSSYGGHPFFTRQVCSKVHHLTQTNRPRAVPLNRVTAAQEEFSNQLESYLFDIIYNLRATYPEEFRLLRLLVIGERQEFDEFFSEAPDLIDHLIGYGLVVKRDGIAEIAFDAIERAVLKIEPNLAAISNDEKWAEICILRGNIEQAIRKALFFWSRNLEPDLWNEILSASLSKRRFDDLNNISPKYLFSNSTTPLYFSDLITLFGDTRVLPYLDGSRSPIRGNMNKVNQYRSDAHAKNVSEDEYADAISALEFLEEEFIID